MRDPPGAQRYERDVLGIGVTQRRTSWTAAELIAETFPDPVWAVPGVLCEGLNLLAGAPKVGKSWFALDVEQGDALYLALEDPPRRMQDRLGKCSPDQSRPRRSR